MRPNFFDFELYRWRGAYRPKDECSGCHALAELLKATVRLSRLWLKRIRERRELVNLDYRQQRDIGLTPAEIERECRKPFWRA
jgi:uncharacterized protein YjiS (DUF1127 family)